MIAFLKLTAKRAGPFATSWSTTKRFFSRSRALDRGWSRLVRFREAKTGAVLYGETGSSDKCSARVIEFDGSVSTPSNLFDRLMMDDGITVSDRKADIGELLAPLPSVPIFLCIGLNYKRHAAEVQMPTPAYPILFTKPSQSLNHPGSPIVIPKIATNQQADYEAELAVVIGRPCKNVRMEDALSYVLGYTAGNDVSTRKWQGLKLGGSQWCFSKGFDGFAPIGPTLVRSSAVKDVQNLRLQTRLNGMIMQDSNTSDMIFSVAELISFLSQGTTLMPGTVILTGTPEGVGFTRSPPVFMEHGDTVEVTVADFGTLRNKVVHENE